MKKDASSVPYRDAITAFANFVSSPACNSDCQATLANVTPEAYYLYGAQLLQQKRYQQAITEFSTLEAQYASSAYASQGHAKAATAYLAYGQDQISGQQCTGAVSTFTTLVTSYKDTPEAKTAQNALNAPQDVTGFITGAPTNPSPTVHLSKHMNFNTLLTTPMNTRPRWMPRLEGIPLSWWRREHITFPHRVRSLARPITWCWTDYAQTPYYSITVAPLCPVKVQARSP